MTKDYAKSRPRLITRGRNRYQTTPSNPRRLPSWAWMLFGLLFGIVLSSLIFWKIMRSHSPGPVSSSLAAENTRIESIKAQKKSERAAKKNKSSKLTEQNTKSTTHTLIKPATPPEARFDFYTLLPTMGVDPLLINPVQPSKKTTLPYILQAGSFKTQAQADQLKAALTLQGLEAHIQIVNVNAAESWYRVYMGPFDTKASALSVQQSLENGPGQGLERLNSVILKMRVS